jgi:hypothetical protein
LPSLLADMSQRWTRGIWWVMRGKPLHKQCYKVGFEFVGIVRMKSSVFWEVTTCSLLELHWCFKGISANFCQSTSCYIQEHSTLQYFLAPLEGLKAYFYFYNASDTVIV